MVHITGESNHAGTNADEAEKKIRWRGCKSLTHQKKIWEYCAQIRTSFVATVGDVRVKPRDV